MSVLTAPRPSWLWAALALAGLPLGLGMGACYVEPTEPPNFRYSCDSNADCDQEGHACISGLCQRTCTSLTSAEDCPSDEGYIMCLNGTCASICTVGQGTCPDPQECVELPSDLGGLGGGFGLGEDAGLCGELCNSETHEGCPEGELCFDGFCVGFDDGTDEETGT